MTDTASNHHFVYDVAHDLQTPLAALRAHLDLIERRRDTAPKLAVCREIIDSMSGMVSTMLAYARAESELHNHTFVRFNMSARVLNAVDCIAHIASQCGVGLSVCIAPGISVRGVPTKIDEVILNLTSNALKYLPPTGRRDISIVLERDGAWCRCSVADTGIGIPPDELPHVFTRFYRTTAAVQHAPGTGLGLAITKKIVEAHGGTISIESTEGHGTRVEIRLPIAAPDARRSQSDHPRA